MKNVINYYYNLTITKIIFKNNYYQFNYNNKLYIFTLLPSTTDESEIKKIEKYSNQNLLFHTIIKNKFNKYISKNNGLSFILLEININPHKKISLGEINYINHSIKMYEYTPAPNWSELWAKKIDYLEQQINENGKKYPLIVDSFNFFVGLCENAISYHNTIIEKNKNENAPSTIVHKKIAIADTIYTLYNPLNLTFDHKSRDIAEYIKLSFFTNNSNIFNELSQYFKFNYYSKFDINKLFARILYPSFYFELYDEIILGQKKETDLLPIIDKINDYILFINKIYIFLSNYYPLEEILWLKKAVNQH